MELKFMLNDGEQLNNFAFAEVIYRYCTSEINSDCLDPSIVANMILEQVRGDRLKQVIADRRRVWGKEI